MNFSKNLYLIVLLVACGVLFNCCATYPNNSSGNWVVNKEYNHDDTIYIKDYVFNHVFVDAYTFKKNKVREVKTDSDSVFNIFKYSVQRLGKPIKFIDSNQNKTNDSFFSNLKLDPEKIDERKIIELAKGGKDSIILIPLIQIYTEQESYSLLAAAYGIYPRYLNLITMSFYMVKNERIIYFSSTYISRATSKYILKDTHESLEYRTKLIGDYWNAIVRNTIREYFK